MILISALVTILGSCLGSGIEYLFVDILSAPTAQVTQVEALEALQSRQFLNNNSAESKTKPGLHNRRRSSILLGATSSPTASTSVLRRQGKDGLRRMSAMVPLMTDEDARIVPSELMIAHQHALDSFDRIMIQRKGLVDQTCEARKVRRQSCMSDLRISPVGVPTERRSGAWDHKSDDRLRSRSVDEEKGATTGHDDENDEVYLALSHEIELEREANFMTAEERLFFDGQWGLGSVDGRAGIESSVGIILKKELKFVNSEVKKKVKKLRSARSIHVGRDLSSFHPPPCSLLLISI
jgi:hypothetical protein